MDPLGTVSRLEYSHAMDAQTLKEFFTKEYGQPFPSQESWRGFYDENVHFQDPTQERQGFQAFIESQEALVKRCDDVFLKPSSVAIDGDSAFVEWQMGLKIKGIEFLYPGVSRLTLGKDGKIIDHRDYFDFIAPTLGPVPVVGGFVRWLYNLFSI